MESKGRTHGFDSAAMLRAKEQVEALASVKGEAVTLRVALQAHFGGDYLQCAMRDPEPPEERERRIDLSLRRERFFEGYYRPYREWLASVPNARVETVRGQAFRIADIREVDLAVGLREDALKAKKPPVRGRPAGEPALAREMPDEKEYVGRDGVLVRAGALWSPDNMRLEPQARQRPTVTTRGAEPEKG